MRIVELINSLEIGGAEKMVVDLSLQLKARGHAVTVVCLRGKGPLAAVLEQQQIDVLPLDKAEGVSMRALAQLTAYLRDCRVDVIHTHNPLVHHYGVAAAVRASVPVVVNTIHGPSNLPGLSLSQMLFDLGCLLSSQVVACCEMVGRHTRNSTYCAKAKTTVIGNGIRCESFLNVPPRPSSSEVVFGTIGRLVPVKDHRTLLRAFATAQPKTGPSRLHILGDGPLRAGLEAYSRELGIAHLVSFRGFGLDTASFLGDVDIFVLSSVSEGLPLTVLEAMAAGRPVVGAAVGAIPELVQASRCGWVVQPNNPASLAEALTAAASSHDRAELGKRGRDYVLRHHSVEVMSAAYEQLFTNLLDNRARGTRRESNVQPTVN